jgi:DNA-directed RNA polymerase beta subunit
VPVESSSLTLVSNGFDEAIQFHLSSDFVLNAEEDGEVVDIDTDAGFIMVKYKSGKTQAVNLNPEVVKNSGGGFYTSNQLKPVYGKVGQKFKKDEVLAFHDKYFKYSKLNGLRYTLGPLVKVAIISSYNTYEDAGICTYELAEKMKTKIVYQESATFKRNSNIFYMAKIGDSVTIGDPLIKYDISFDDNEISKYLSKLSEENKAAFEAETKNEIKTNHAGKIVDIKVYTLQDPSNLSPTLGNIVKSYFDKINNRKKFLEKYDNTPGIVKAGQIIRDSTSPLHTRYNVIKGYKGIDVLVEFYIEHDDVMGVGDKIAVYGANKQIISELIPKGYEPYSEFRPDEEISAICSPGTLARRMTMSTTTIAAAMKIMLELKRKIKKEIKYK